MLTNEPLKNTTEQKAYAGINVAECRYCLHDSRGEFRNTVKVPVTLRELAYIKTRYHLTKTVECCGLGSPTHTKHQVTVTLTA